MYIYIYMSVAYIENIENIFGKGYNRVIRKTKWIGQRDGVCLRT